MKQFKKLFLGVTLVLTSLLIIMGGTKLNAQAAKIDYRKPSESKPYPNVQKNPGMWIHVNLKKQRVYLMSKKNKKLYTMYCSSGAHNATPTGTYHIEDIRGDTFYNQAEKAGANYYVAWKGNDFLFHSVPINDKGQYNKKQASYLGKKPMSHGCIRLSIPDSQWMYKNIPTGTKVVISKN
ncbi:L,D-transpeptidase [uncultured Limosilactobacillus sp.]|uniref:L,D-transpeptidase n=1 Tax=uncultured Limosilactobacillus sp. TaxID=2837629 RepID=UPI0025D084ED|nr:L,D-transpeptidase [uncultured Limosilactobacillus sp.]